MTACAYSSGVPTAWVPDGSPLSGSRSWGKPPPKSSSSGCHAKRSRSSAMHSAIEARRELERLGSGAEPADVEVQAPEANRVEAERRRHDLEHRRPVHAPLVVARVRRDPRQIGLDGRLVRVREGQHPQADVGLSTHLLCQAGHNRELARLVDVDRHARLDRCGQLRGLLVAAVQDELVGGDAGSERHRQLAEPEAVAAHAFLHQHAADRQIRVRLRREEERHVRPARLERLAQPAGRSP